MRYLIWGTGYQSNAIYEANCNDFSKYDVEIVGFIDNNKSNELFHDIKVYRPDEIAGIEYDYIDIWVVDDAFYEIRKQIKNELKISDDRIKNVFEDIIKKLVVPYMDDVSYKLPSDELFSACVDYYRAQQWYKHSYRALKMHNRVYYVYEWINKNIGKNDRILDIACGAGELLYYLRSDGFENLFGYDIDDKTLQAAKKINELTHSNIQIFKDDAAMPKFSDKFDVMVWMTGLYLMKNFKLQDFFDGHLEKLNDNGYIIFEMVDILYNEMPMNQYHTQDWKQPGKKRPSEYKLRMSYDDVISKAKDYGLEFIKKYDVPKYAVPFKIYIFKKTKKL